MNTTANKLALFMGTINPEVINTIEREKLIYIDHRNESTNTRFKVYEVEEDNIYLLVVRRNGELLKVNAAQNPLTLMLKTSL